MRERQEQRKKRKGKRKNWTDKGRKQYRERVKERLVRGEGMKEEWKDMRGKIMKALEQREKNKGKERMIG